MAAAWDFVVAHSTIFSLVSFYICSAFIGALPAPTAQSTRFYQFFFSFCNILGANLMRARSTTIEGSPNWAAALKQAQQNGGNKQ